MTAAEKVFEFLKSNKGQHICSKCLCESLNYDQQQRVTATVEALGLTSDFDRIHGECSLCKSDRKVISYTR